MIKTIFNKVLENIGEIIFSGIAVAVGTLITRNKEICVAIVARLASYPRITVFGISVGIVGATLIVHLLYRRVKRLSKECQIMAAKIKAFVDPMRNLVLEGSTSIYKDTEQDRFICPKCFADNKSRSYLERTMNSECEYEAFTYLCHVCGFKTYDITGLDKSAAAAKAKKVEANREALFSNSVFGCI